GHRLCYTILEMLLHPVFFFSSRRRHTRFSRDWSSDVCSSDLVAGDGPQCSEPGAPQHGAWPGPPRKDRSSGRSRPETRRSHAARSEERRVGRGCRSRWGWGRKEEGQGKGVTERQKATV